MTLTRKIYKLGGAGFGRGGPPLKPKTKKKVEESLPQSGKGKGTPKPKVTSSASKKERGTGQAIQPKVTQNTSGKGKGSTPKPKVSPSISESAKGSILSTINSKNTSVSALIDALAKNDDDEYESLKTQLHQTNESKIISEQKIVAAKGKIEEFENEIINKNNENTTELMDKEIEKQNQIITTEEANIKKYNEMNDDITSKIKLLYPNISNGNLDKIRLGEYVGIPERYISRQSNEDSEDEEEIGESPPSSPRLSSETKEEDEEETPEPNEEVPVPTPEPPKPNEEVPVPTPEPPKPNEEVPVPTPEPPKPNEEPVPTSEPPKPNEVPVPEKKPLPVLTPEPPKQTFPPFIDLTPELTSIWNDLDKTLGIISGPTNDDLDIPLLIKQVKQITTYALSNNRKIIPLGS
jgi:hypothetical protein